MLQLNSYLPALTEKIISEPNLTGHFEDEDLKRIGATCLQGLEADEYSRYDWMRRNEIGMDLALQITQPKNEPWPGCSNVAFPLVTIGGLQFQARAYPALINGTQVARYAAPPNSPPEVTERGNRIGATMSWQLLHEDVCWEPQTDMSFLTTAIVGTSFKKSYRDGDLKMNVSELVLAKNLVLNYWSKSVDACGRKTQLIPLSRNEIYTRVKRGVFRDVLEEGWYKAAPPVSRSEAQIQQDQRAGITPPQPDDLTPFTICEQHCDLDLDDDGYAEPYIITFERSSCSILRIVTRFDAEDAIERNKAKEIIRIRSDEYFTKVPFVPSPDGGIYDVGFGALLGPLNASVNSLINMLLDSGTLQTTAGGFLGRGAKIRGGNYESKPWEWQRVDSTGDDLRKSIYQHQFPQPSNVLFQLLGLLIDYTNRIAGTQDINVGGNPGQNTPASTTQTMVEMGEKIYSAIYKRLWRAMSEEYKKLFILNGKYGSVDQTFPGGATVADFQLDSKYVCPVADPNISSERKLREQAVALKAAAASTPGYNVDAVERRYLEAFQIENIDQVFPGGAKPQPDPKLVIAQMQNETALQELELRKTEVQLKGMEVIGNLQEDQRLNNAKIVELEAKAAAHAADAQSEQAYAQIAMVNAQIAAAKEKNAVLDRQLSHVVKMIELQTTTALGAKKLKIEEKKLENAGE